MQVGVGGRAGRGQVRLDRPGAVCRLRGRAGGGRRAAKAVGDQPDIPQTRIKGAAARPIVSGAEGRIKADFGGPQLQGRDVDTVRVAAGGGCQGARTGKQWISLRDACCEILGRDIKGEVEGRQVRGQIANDGGIDCAIKRPPGQTRVCRQVCDRRIHSARDRVGLWRDCHIHICICTGRCGGHGNSRYTVQSARDCTVCAYWTTQIVADQPHVSQAPVKGCVNRPGGVVAGVGIKAQGRQADNQIADSVSCFRRAREVRVDCAGALKQAVSLGNVDLQVCRDCGQRTVK